MLYSRVNTDIWMVYLTLVYLLYKARWMMQYIVNHLVFYNIVQKFLIGGFAG